MLNDTVLRRRLARRGQCLRRVAEGCDHRRNFTFAGTATRSSGAEGVPVGLSGGIYTDRGGRDKRAIFGAPLRAISIAAPCLPFAGGRNWLCSFL